MSEISNSFHYFSSNPCIYVYTVCLAYALHLCLGSSKTVLPLWEMFNGYEGQVSIQSTIEGIYFHYKRCEIDQFNDESYFLFHSLKYWEL